MEETGAACVFVGHFARRCVPHVLTSRFPRLRCGCGSVVARDKRPRCRVLLTGGQIKDGLGLSS